MKGVAMILLSLLIFNFVSASCDEGQIDLNTATASALENLEGIGPTKAAAIIDARPFDSVDALLEVYGIGEKTLEKKKTQGLACVEETEKSEKKEETEKEVIEVEKESNFEENKKEKVVEPIKLTPKNIKSEDSPKEGSTSAIYPFVGFCLLLFGLYLVKPRKRKNEWKK